MQRNQCRHVDIYIVDRICSKWSFELWWANVGTPDKMQFFRQTSFKERQFKNCNLWNTFKSLSSEEAYITKATSQTSSDVKIHVSDNMAKCSLIGVGNCSAGQPFSRQPLATNWWSKPQNVKHNPSKKAILCRTNRFWFYLFSYVIGLLCCVIYIIAFFERLQTKICVDL